MLDTDPADLMAWQELVHVLAKAERAEEALARVEAAFSTVRGIRSDFSPGKS